MGERKKEKEKENRDQSACLPPQIGILKKVCWGVAAVDLKNRSCGKEVGNPVVTSVDIQATILE